jgi:hypothetical protein
MLKRLKLGNIFISLIGMTLIPAVTSCISSPVSSKALPQFIRLITINLKPDSIVRSQNINLTGNSARNIIEVPTGQNEVIAKASFFMLEDKIWGN